MQPLPGAALQADLVGQITEVVDLLRGELRDEVVAGGEVIA